MEYESMEDAVGKPALTPKPSHGRPPPDPTRRMLSLSSPSKSRAEVSRGAIRSARYFCRPRGREDKMT